MPTCNSRCLAASSTPLLLKLLNIPTGVEEPTDDERLDDGRGECEIRRLVRHCAPEQAQRHRGTPCTRKAA
jgi:hypothetical protein